MTVYQMKEFLTYVWYFFLICLLIYLIIGIGYSLIKQIKRENDNKKLVNELIEEILKDEKK